MCCIQMGVILRFGEMTLMIFAKVITDGTG